MTPDPPTPNPEPGTRNSEPALRPLGVAEIRARFGYPNDAAALRLLQKMRRSGHAARIFGQLSTDEAHLALWYHDQFLPPPRPLPIDTLEKGTRNVIAYMIRSGQMEVWPAGALEALRRRVEALEAANQPRVPGALVAFPSVPCLASVPSDPSPA